MDEIILYHGSRECVEFPEIRQTKYNKDFYFGFYCTVLREQAKRWAVRHSGKGIINEYLFQPDESLKIVKFSEMTEEWLDFIVACRSGKSHDYDIVEGPMADDQIWNYVEGFISGKVPRDVFWELVKFSYPTHQIVFCTEDALKTLTFEGSETL